MWFTTELLERVMSTFLYLLSLCRINYYWIMIIMNTTHRSFFQGSPQGGNVVNGTPHFSDQTLVGDIKTALVQYIVNGLHLLDLDDPGVNWFWSFDQDLSQIVLCPMENLECMHDDEFQTPWLSHVKHWESENICILNKWFCDCRDKSSQETGRDERK